MKTKPERELGEPTGITINDHTEVIRLQEPAQVASARAPKAGKKKAAPAKRKGGGDSTKTADNKRRSAAKAAAQPAGPRDSSKAAQLIEMLKQPGGATLEAICEKFGWQQHTTRAMMSAGGSLTKKYGLVVASEKTEAGRVYAIAS